MKTHAIGFPSVSDEAGALAEQYGVHGVPATFVIDARGAHRDLPRGEIDDAFIDRALETAVGENVRLDAPACP